MKKTKLTIIFILFSTVSFACSCDWGGNFIRTAKNADLIILAKVTLHNFHLVKNGKTFSSMEDAVVETFKSEYDNDTNFYESIDLEIIEIIKGSETKKLLEYLPLMEQIVDPELEVSKLDKYICSRQLYRNIHYQICQTKKKRIISCGVVRKHQLSIKQMTIRFTD